MIENKKSRRNSFFIYKPLQLFMLKIVISSCLLTIVSMFLATLFFFKYLENIFNFDQNKELYILIQGLLDYSKIYFMFVSISILLSGVIIWYAWLKLSHKIAGPLYHIKKNIDSGLVDQNFQTIKLRNGDELTDLADSVNKLFEIKMQKQQVENNI